MAKKMVIVALNALAVLCIIGFVAFNANDHWNSFFQGKLNAVKTDTTVNGLILMLLPLSVMASIAVGSHEWKRKWFGRNNNITLSFALPSFIINMVIMIPLGYAATSPFMGSFAYITGIVLFFTNHFTTIILFDKWMESGKSPTNGDGLTSASESENNPTVNGTHDPIQWGFFSA